VADAGYYEGQAIVDCYEAGIQALVPKVNTSSSKSKGKYSKADFKYDAERNEYVCPAGERLTYRFDSVEKGKRLWVYERYGCSSCVQRPQCTTATEKRIKRWEHEDLLDKAQDNLKKHPEACDSEKRLRSTPSAPSSS
jgi:hypothetical protein